MEALSSVCEELVLSLKDGLADWAVEARLVPKCPAKKSSTSAASAWESTQVAG